MNQKQAFKPLSIVAFMDGRAGHEKQTRGIISALEELTATSVDFYQIRPPSALSFFIQLVQLLLPAWGPAQIKEDVDSIDIVIGTGSRTHLAVLQKKKQCNASQKTSARAITCMSPDFWFASGFDLIAVPIHDQPDRKENIITTIGPPNLSTFSTEHDKNKGLILLGGTDPKSHTWDEQQIVTMCEVICNTGLEWTISSSPRTPESTCSLFENLASDHSNILFFRSADTGPRWIDEQYMNNYYSWVTADSVSMVYEALTAGCAVGILPVQWNNLSNKFEQNLQHLRENNYIISYNEWKKGRELRSAYPPLNESERCAKEILKRWWPERLNNK